MKTQCVGFSRKNELGEVLLKLTFFEMVIILVRAVTVAYCMDTQVCKQTIKNVS